MESTLRIEANMIRIIIICVMLWLLGSLAYGVVSPKAGEQGHRNMVELTHMDGQR